MMRTILKKWYKFQQDHRSKKFDSHWYIRFGWQKNPLEENQLNNLFEIHSPKKFTFADCFYAEENNRHFIFFEEVDDQHPVGFLSVTEVFKDGHHTEPQPILKLDYHLSYPCIFKHENTWYMIPETSRNKTIELWECTDFPLHWKLNRVLVDNIQAADTTPYFHDGYWYLFTTLKHKNCKKYGNELHIFYSQDLFSSSWTAHPQNPVKKSLLQVRPAGHLCHIDGQLIRPSQDSLKRYGGSLDLNIVSTLSPTQYAEKFFKKLDSEWHPEDNGCHTFNFNGNFVVMDAIRETPLKK
ncbi:hypothetical protein [Acinetobacter towneri]|uniref:glucosamine inositolphosphorylceramide transferase family protein n=1 Tax=Acinetobacter towneri TaxID=202956 RepID=UPI003A842709